MKLQLDLTYFTFRFVKKSKCFVYCRTARWEMQPIEHLTKNQSLGLPNGPYDLNKDNVKKLIEKKRIGNYAIGYISPLGGFAPKMIGRSDKDLHEEIINKIDLARRKGYDKFCFKYSDSLKEGFERECLNYHTFKRQLDDKMHPIPPKNNDLKCPNSICAQFFKSGKNN